MPPRRCMTPRCPNGATPSRSRCWKHGGGAWQGQQARKAAYGSDYQANRAIILRGDPLCYWCRTAPATTADHLRAVAQGGGHEVSNLVPACEPCNRLRGASLGGQVTKARREQKR